jgi:transcription antitermination factor NusG
LPPSHVFQDEQGISPEILEQPEFPTFVAELRPWYVLRVQTGREINVLHQLEKRRIEAYVPQYTELKRASHRRPEPIIRPLFPGYVLARFRFERRMDALQNPGVIGFVAFGDQPAAVEHSEIESIRQMVASGLAKPFDQRLKFAKGQKVRVTSGPLTGARGTLVKIKHQFRVVVMVDMLGRGVSAEVDPATLSPDE